jgi:hypothetical protein
MIGGPDVRSRIKYGSEQTASGHFHFVRYARMAVAFIMGL